MIHGMYSDSLSHVMMVVRPQESHNHSGCSWSDFAGQQAWILQGRLHDCRGARMMHIDSLAYVGSLHRARGWIGPLIEPEVVACAAQIYQQVITRDPRGFGPPILVLGGSQWATWTPSPGTSEHRNSLEHCTFMWSKSSVVSWIGEFLVVQENPS